MIETRFPMIVGTWAPNMGVDSVEELAKAVVEPLRDVSRVSPILCPPFASLTAVSSIIADTGVALGAPALGYKQAMGVLDPVTSAEWSAATLANRCDYVVVGHWALDDKNNNDVLRDTVAALRHGMKPIICVGDDPNHKRTEATRDTIRRQVSFVLSGIADEDSSRPLAIAYEPVWAIQAGRSLMEHEIASIMRFIRQLVAEKWGDSTARTIPLLYGGINSVEDAIGLAASSDVDGILLSGHNLDAETFIEAARSFSRDTASTTPPSSESASPETTGKLVAVETEHAAEQNVVLNLLISELLPTLSEISNAIQSLEKSGLGERESQGLRLIRDKLEDFQHWQGITRVGWPDEVFDSEIHHAIGTDERSDRPSRVVVEVVRAGYRIRDRVVQKAEVIVNR